MNPKRIILSAALVGSLLASSPAMAIPAPLKAAFDGMTVSPNPGVSSATDADQVPEGVDSTWAIGASGASVSAIRFEIAGNAGLNTFGVFDPTDPTKRVELFDGAASPGALRVLSILAVGSVLVNLVDTLIDFAGNTYGYYLDGPGGLFYSKTSLNGDGVDHMLAYRGEDIDTISVPPFSPGIWNSNEYALAWEDTFGGGDSDYEDFVMLAESITPNGTPVPDNASMLMLLGLAMTGLGSFHRFFGARANSRLGIRK